MLDAPPLSSRRWRRVRRCVLAVVIFLLVCGAVLMINASRIPSRQLDVAAVDVTVDADAIAQSLAEFLAVPSYSHSDRSQMDPEAFRRLHRLLEQHYPHVHRVLERETVNESSLLYRWSGQEQSLQPILLMSHLDVVPVDEATSSEWLFPYDDGTVAEGHIWGRGALDVKCGVIGIMAAVEHLLEEGFTPRRTVYLAFGHDEEVGGAQGNAAIAGRLAERGIRLEFVCDEGGAILDGVIPGAPRPVAFVAIAEKSSATLELTAYGEGGHGSMPGRSAVVNLAEAIRRIEQQPMPARMTDATAALLEFLAPEMPPLTRTVLGNRWLFDGLIASQFARSPSTNAVVRSTLNVTQLRTENAENVTPPIAWATINARLLPGDTAEDVRDHVLAQTADLLLHNGQGAIECTVLRSSSGAPVSPIDDAQFQLLQRTIHEVFPDVIVAAGLTSVATDSRWYSDLTDRIYRFIPMRMTSGDMARIHGTNERIGVENMAEIVRFYIQLIRNTSLEAQPAPPVTADQS